MRPLTDIETLAVAKLLTETSEKRARANIEPGSYRVALDLRAEVLLNVGADYEQKIVAKADPWTLLAAALSHLNGVTVDSLVSEALTASPDLVASIKSRAQVALDKIKAPTLSPCKGKVTVPKRTVEALAGNEKTFDSVMVRAELTESGDLSEMFAALDGK